jgi:4'-phosphopantetheinyl transferase EntD
MISERFFQGSGVAVACRPVLPDDSRRLTAGERESLVLSVHAARNRAAAARLAARELLSDAGFAGWNLPRRRGAAPEWPAGLVGSLAHADRYAAAALADARKMAGIGIDIEPAEPLPEEIVDLVIAPGEPRPAGGNDLVGRLLFCAKEASYKAVYPLDGRFLEHHEVLVDLRAGVAETSYGRKVEIALHVDHRIIALAFVRARGTLPLAE